MSCKFCGRVIPERLTSAGFCPFCGKTLTKAGHPALEISRTEELENQIEHIAAATNERSGRTKQRLAILGALLLFVGVFLPIMSVPIVGSMNYFHNGQGDGTIILVLAVISSILAITRRFRGLWITGLCSVGLLLFGLVNFLIRMSQLREQMQTELSDNPFKGLADVAMNSVQLEWGWAVLMLGGILILVAAAMPGPAFAAPQPVSGARTTAKWVGASIALFILLGLASLLNTNKAVENNSTVQQAVPMPSGIVTSQRAQAENSPPGYPYFSDGTHVVGQDVSPGTYRTRTASPGCYYSRLAGFGGTLGDIISNENTDAPAVVTISPNDKGFVSRRCGIWTQDLSAITSSRYTFADGVYIIGTDIKSGTYRNNGHQGCYYERLSGFGGNLEETLANENTDSPAVVTISPADRGFKSARCGIWNLISSAQPSPETETSVIENSPIPNPPVGEPSTDSVSEPQTRESQKSFSTYPAQLRSVVVSRGFHLIGATKFFPADSKGNKLFVQHAACNDVRDGRCQKLFIAFNDRFLGTDTFLPSWEVHDVAQENLGSFSAVYEDLSDQNRNSPPVKVIYTWDGEKLTASATPPTRPNTR